MSTDVFPQSVKGRGTVRVQWVPELANPEEPELTEVNGTDAIDLSSYFRAEDFQINMDQARDDDTRLSDDSARESLGLATFTADAFSYIHNPQAPDDTPGNRAFEVLGDGVAGYFVVRFGPKSSLPFVATQRVQVFAVTCGVQHQPIPVGDNASHIITQPITLSRETGNNTLTA